VSLSTDNNTVEWLSAEQAHDLFDQRAQDILGLSREEFIFSYLQGDFEGCEEDPGVRDLLALLPFATAT
jgi:hypothetical protein